MSRVYHFFMLIIFSGAILIYSFRLGNSLKLKLIDCGYRGFVLVIPTNDKSLIKYKDGFYTDNMDGVVYVDNNKISNDLIVDFYSCENRIDNDEVGWIKFIMLPEQKHTRAKKSIYSFYFLNKEEQKLDYSEYFVGMVPTSTKAIKYYHRKYKLLDLMIKTELSKPCIGHRCAEK